MLKINRIFSPAGMILFMIFSLLLQPAFGASENNQWTILESRGDIYQYKDEIYIPLREDHIENQLIRIGEVIEVKDFAETPQKVQEHWSVLKLNNQITLTVPNGTMFQLKVDEEDPSKQNLFLEGIAHIFLMPENEDQTVSMDINGTLIESKKSYLYFNGQQDSFNLVVIAGEVILPVSSIDSSDAEAVTSDASTDSSDVEAVTSDSTADSLDAEVATSESASTTDTEKDVSDKIILPEGAGITKHDGEIIDQTNFSFNRKLFELSTIRGYETLGDYQKVGSVTFDQGFINILRFQKSIDIYRTPTSLFKGDKIMTGQNQTADLAFLSKDDIKVSGSSEFVIDEYQQIEDNISFNFLGKIRAKIKKRKRKGKIKFKTATALIGVKGTDFEAIASKASSEIATVEGVVGVSDPSGAGEVDVTEGMMTSVDAGELPKEPVPIPPDRFKQLLLVGGLAIVGLTDVTNLTLIDGASYTKPVLNFQIVPENALYEVYLDQKLIQNFKLDQPLGDLTDGQHLLEIKGLGEPPFTKSIQFTLDTQPPLILEKEVPKDTWELIEKRPLKTTWNEAIESAEVMIGETKVQGKVVEDGVSVEFTFDQIPAFFQKEAEHVASLIAFDKVGNKQELAIKLKILNPIQPVLSISGKPTELKLPIADDIIIQSDQTVKNWVMKLGDQLLDVLKTQPDLAGARTLIVPKTVLNTEIEGIYQLSVTAENAAGKMGALKLRLTLDKTKPKIQQVIPKMDTEKLVLPAENPIKIVFSEKIVSLEAKIKSEKWDLKLASDGLSATIKADKLITSESQPFHIRFFDQANLFGEIFGQIKTTAKPKDKPKDKPARNSKVLLEKAYVNTILLKSNTVLDQTILNNRLPFYFNDSLISVDSLEGFPESDLEFKYNDNWLKEK